MGIGILAGITLSGPAAQTATEVLSAKPSSQPIYLDSVQVELEAYSIHDNDFVKLRDIDEVVGFNVYWEGSAVTLALQDTATGIRKGNWAALRIYGGAACIVSKKQPDKSPRLNAPLPCLVIHFHPSQGQSPFRQTGCAYIPNT